MLYSDRVDAIQKEIVDPLGEYASDHNIDAIAENILEWVEKKNDQGQILTNKSGYKVKDNVDFWRVVEANAIN